MTNQLVSNQDSGVAICHSHLDGLISRTTASAFWKDTAGNYLGANDWHVARSGAKSHSNLIGANDADLFMQDYVVNLRKNDSHVIANEETILFIESVKKLNAQQPKNSNANHYLSYKSPLLNRSGNVIGVFGLSYSLNDKCDIAPMMKDLTLIAGKQVAESAHKLILRQHNATLKLTNRQVDCLRLLAKGMTIRQIASALALSHRTVEHYLEAIKLKLKCTTRFELIAKSEEYGLLY